MASMSAFRAVAVASLFVSGSAWAAEIREFSLFGATPPALLARPLELPASPLERPEPAPQVQEARRPPSTGKIVALAGAYQAGVAGAGYLMWWKGRGLGTFVAKSEGWFGPETYAGGADKTSHFVFGYLGSRAFRSGYEAIGVEPRAARLLGGASGVLGAWAVELGDGFSEYRFSWEDGLITSAGAAAAVLLTEADLDDTLRFRWGKVPHRTPKDPWSPEPNKAPSHYSAEITTMDLSLAGLLPRVGARPGLARFLLVSATYATKGFSSIRPQAVERQVGLEVGLDLYEVARAAGVSDRSFWGGTLLFALRHFRVPFTGVGIRYEVGSHRFHGPDFGDRFYGDVSLPPPSPLP
ncbi:MAG: DUF2279 domain-containing protein [Acidobacteria bacterium]|nr:DUF2279 domain-containing protein [Acidobacteriota bacterium]